MEFGEVLRLLGGDCPKTTGYDENIILLKEIERVFSEGCKTDLILDIVEVDEQWIVDSEDEVNILICSELPPHASQLTDGEVDLCRLFNTSLQNYIGFLVAAPRHSDIFFNHFSETYSRAEWEGYAPEQLKELWFQKYLMYVVLGSKTGFRCLNWTHNQLQQLMQKVI